MNRNMKALAFATLALLCFVPGAMAAGNASAERHFLWPIRWQTSLAAVRNSPVESSFVSHSAPTASALLLTSITDTTVQFQIPRLADITTFAAGDSGRMFNFFFCPNLNPNLTTAADTAIVTLQMSYNGQNWISAPTITLLPSGVSTSNSFSRWWNAVLDQAPPATATNASLGSFPIFRMIVKSDFNGEMGAGIQWWTSPGSFHELPDPTGPR